MQRRSLNSTIPICVTLLDWGFFNRRRPRVWTGIGLAAGIAGVALIVHQASSLAALRGAGYLAALAIAIVTWSVGTLLQRHAVPREKLLALGCGQMAAGSAFLFLAALVHGEQRSSILRAWRCLGWLALFYLVVFGSLLAQTAYLWLLARRPAEKVTTYAVVNPVIALLLGAVVLGEPVHAGERARRTAGAGWGGPRAVRAQRRGCAGGPAEPAAAIAAR